MMDSVDMLHLSHPHSSPPQFYPIFLLLKERGEQWYRGRTLSPPSHIIKSTLFANLTTYPVIRTSCHSNLHLGSFDIMAENHYQADLHFLQTGKSPCVKCDFRTQVSLQTEPHSSCNFTSVKLRSVCPDPVAKPEASHFVATAGAVVSLSEFQQMPLRGSSSPQIQVMLVSFTWWPVTCSSGSKSSSCLRWHDLPTQQDGVCLVGWSDPQKGCLNPDKSGSS